MTSGLYASCLDALMGGDVDLVNTPVSAMLIDLDQYTADLDADTSLADIPEVSIISKSLLTGKAIVDAVFSADPTVFTSVSADDGVDIGAIVVFKDVDTASESTLLYYSDEAPELPATPDGEDVTVTWGGGTGEVFGLS